MSTAREPPNPASTIDRLDGHVALITGGNGGIGLGMALGLAQAGASVVLWGTNEAKTVAAAEQVRAIDGAGDVLTVIGDVSREDHVVAGFAEAVAAFGHVDSVFANAGVPGHGEAFVDLSLDEWHRVLAVNLDGVFLTLREGARHIIEHGGPGSLVAISSVSAVHGAPRNQAYASSKTALLGLVRSLAVELARYHIRVNAVLPGWTITEMATRGRTNQKFVDNTTYRTPLRRWAEPDEFGPLAVFLADPRIPFHTGDSIVMDGGYSIF